MDTAEFIKKINALSPRAWVTFKVGKKKLSGACRPVSIGHNAGPMDTALVNVPGDQTYTVEIKDIVKIEAIPTSRILPALQE